MSPMRALIDLDRVGTLFLHKIARAVELIELGLSSHTIYHRCRPNGPWQRLLPGVILLSSAPPGRTERIQAALRYAGTGALVTGWDALALHGMKNTVCGGPVHLLVPLDKQVRSATTVQIERTKRLPRPTMRSGFPVTHLSRAALDATRRIDDVDQARATLAEAVQRGTTPAALRAELGCGSNRGSALPRRVLHEIDDGIRSAAEAWARDLLSRCRLPKPMYNAHVYSADGSTLLGIVDAWWDEVALGWEIDSYEFHFKATDYRDTMARHNKFTAAGAIMVHTLPSALRRDPKSVVADLTGAYEHARSRPRPPLRIKDC